MYIWVILATFLAILASYTLSVRPDMRELSVTRIAEAALGRIIVQHEAAITHIKYCKYPYSGERNKVDYVPGIIAEDDLQAELPYGYVLDETFTSQVFCMNEDMTVAYDMAGTTNPCDDKNGRRLVVTYGPIPVRWMQLSGDGERPNADFVKAIWNMVSAGEQFGYMIPAVASDVHVSQENPSASDVQLAVRAGTEAVFVPKAVVENPLFRQVCNLDENLGCMVYMSGI